MSKPTMNPYSGYWNDDDFWDPKQAAVKAPVTAYTAPKKPPAPVKKHDDGAYGKLAAPVVELADILAHRRNGFTEGEKRFVVWLKEQLPKSAFQDAFGNLHYSSYPKGKKPTVLFSSHTDTVHNNSEREHAKQKVLYDGILKQFFVDDKKLAHCLGADDGTGVWIMLNMIRAKIPGYYIFHRMEERGGQGSRWIGASMKNMLKQFDIAVAFDRRGTSDVITHQGRRTASDKFAEQLCLALNNANDHFSYKPSDGGTFTDTQVYSDIIPECTNISVGYERAHGHNEFQCVTHAERLLEACCAIDWHSLTAHRDPSAPTTYQSRYVGGYAEPVRKYGNAVPPVTPPAQPKKTASAPAKKKTIRVRTEITPSEAEMIVSRYPEIAAELLASCCEFEDFEELLTEQLLSEYKDDFFPMDMLD